TTCTSWARTVALRRHRDGAATSVSTAFLPYNALRVFDRRPLNLRCSFVVALQALVVCAAPAAAAERPQIVASVEDAFVAYDASTDLWTIGSRQLELVVGLNQDRV